MLSFPYYLSIFYPQPVKQLTIVEKLNSKIVEFKIVGITFISCTEHVNHEVNKLKGIVMSNVSYEQGNSIVQFDNSKTNIIEIEKAINSTGYFVTDKQEK